MVTLSDVFKPGIKHFKMRANAYDRIRKAKKTLERLDKKGGWVEMFLHPLVEALKPFFPGYTSEVLGPFGLGCQVSIYFVKSGSKKRLEVCPDNLEEGLLRVIDPNSESSYQPGMIGHISGLGRHTIKIDKEVSLEQIAKLFTESN